MEQKTLQNQKQTKYEQFAKQINDVLKQFQKVRQWPDIGIWLAKLHPILITKRFGNVPHKIRLTKRLAQCLSPGIPASVHSNALNVYRVILNNYGNKVQMLPLLSIGLFPFFEYCSTALKFQLLILFQNFYIRTPQCLQMITSLINTLLTAFNDNNQELNRKIYDFLDIISQKYGRIWIDGAVWINILNSPKVRNAGYKYFLKSFKDRDKPEQQKNNKSQEHQNQQTKKQQQKNQQKISTQNQINTIATKPIQESQQLNLRQGYKIEKRQQNQTKMNQCKQNQPHKIYKDQNKEQNHNQREQKIRKYSEYKIEEEQQNPTQQDVQQMTIEQKNIQKKYSQKDSTLSKAISLTSDMFLDEASAQLREKLLQNSKKQDSFQTRFPNFQTLVINALQQSLQSQLSDNQIRRATLDIMIFYLNLDRKQDIQQKQAINLVMIILHMINLKQYSLTRRIYTYLFGPPNIEGIYQINNKKSYQISILCKALNQLLVIKTGLSYTPQYYQGILNIISIFFKDNQVLPTFVLPSIAYNILKFIKGSKINSESLYQFQTQIINKNSQIFMNALKQKMQMESVIKRPPQARQVIENLEYFVKLKKNIKEQQKDIITDKMLNSILDWLLRYLQKTKCSYERLSIFILDFCIQLLKQVSDKKLSNQCIQMVNNLIKIKPSNKIYSKLIAIHPQPQKNYLLPYVSQASLSIICINSLLKMQESQITLQQRKIIFSAIFELFKSKARESQAAQFLKKFQNKFQSDFLKLIQEIQPSQWIIYWIKMSGDVSGGVIRMLRKLQQPNKIHKQQIKKWLEDSKKQSTKILDTIFNMLQKTQNNKIQQIYKMLKRVFKAQKSQISFVFFNQIQKYLFPFVNRIFQCIDSGNEDLKETSLDMLQFLLENTTNQDQKLIFISITFQKTLSKLKQIQSISGQQERQIQIVLYFTSMIDSFNSFAGNSQKISILEQILQSQHFFDIMAKGMKLTQIIYLRTLYIQFIERSIQTFVWIGAHHNFISEIIQTVIQGLFSTLKQMKSVQLQQFVYHIYFGDKQQYSQIVNQNSQTINQNQLTIDQKYRQVIQLWNFLNFIGRTCSQNRFKKISTADFITFILQNYPFQTVTYLQVSPNFLNNDYINFQKQVKKMTSLKKQVLSFFQTVWANNQGQTINYLIQKSDPRLLLYAKIDPIVILKSIQKSKIAIEIQKYYKDEHFHLPKGVLHYNSKMLMLQNQLCYFIYMYLAYCDFLSSSIKDDDFYDLILKLIKLINLSHHTQIKIWLFQILYCISQKVSLKIIFTKNQKLKSEIQNLIKDLITQTTPIIANQRLLTLKSQIKIGFFHKITKEQAQSENCLFDFPRPFPPTISKQQYLFLKSMKDLQQSNIYHIQDQTKIFLFTKPAIDLCNIRFKAFVSTIILKTFSHSLIPLLSNIYQNDRSTITSICKSIVSQMIVGVTVDIKNQHDIIVMEAFAQFMRKLTTDNLIKHSIVKQLRKSMLDIFLNKDFFRCTKNTLNYWQPVIDACTQDQDLISQLISKQGFFESLFSSKKKNQATQIEIKNFQRICFLIFCGRVDKYDKKLRVVFQSLSKVMKAQNPSPSLLILILFCIRILFMRLSEAAMNKMFRSIWPSLIALLIQIFTKKKYMKSINLQLAGLKMIELVHALNLEQFNIHKWIFIYDYFGLKLQPQTDFEQKISQQQSKSMLTPFKYKPILVKVLPKQPLKCSFIPEPSALQSYQKSAKRKIIITQSIVDSQQQLQNSALNLFQYMMNLNQIRAFTNRVQFQQLIENDFISFDEYIYKSV